MPKLSSNCNPALLQQSLHEALTEQQEEQLAEHLNQCQPCREQLESLAACHDDWQHIESVLRTEASGEHLIADEGSSSEILLSDFAVDFLQPSPEPDSVGRLNNVQIRSVIGRGGNGIVLKGFQPELNRLIAVKVMAPHLATSAAARQRFAREAQATAAIVHPNVMPILSVNSSGQLPFLVMPYVDCESLQQRLDRCAALPVVDVLRIGLQVARGLAAAHAQGLVHRDVKPANILLERDVDRVMLTDFGLARAVDDASLTRTGLIAGTPQYMSPEQARGDAIDTRSDLFSFGSVLYAISTGRPPFRAETSYGILRRVTDEPQRPATELNTSLPVWLSSIIDRLLAKSAEDRFASANEVAELLEGCLAHVQQPNVLPLPAAARELVQARFSARRLATITLVFAIAVTLPLLLSRYLPSAKDPKQNQGVWHFEQKVKDISPDEVAASATSESVPAAEPNEEYSHDEIASEIQSLDAEIDSLLEATQSTDKAIKPE